MFFILLLLWIIFNGKFTVEILIFGIVISVAVYLFLWKFMDFSPKKELKTLLLVPQGFMYLCTLFWEIIKANCTVLMYIFNSKIEVEPVMVRFKGKLKEKEHKSTLANSITLTPGTITVDLDGDDYLVHCLDKDLAPGLNDSVFVKRLSKMEKASNADIKMKGNKKK